MFGMSKNRMIRVFIYLKKDMSDPLYQNIAPGLAYYFLLSLIPIFLLLGQISGLFSVSMTYIADHIGSYLPEELTDFILPFLSSEIGRGGLIANVIFLVTTLYLASRAMYALIKISDYAYDIPLPDAKFAVTKMFIKQHIKAIIMTFFMLFILLFSLFIIVFGRNAIDLLLTVFHADAFYLYLDKLWNRLVLPLTFILFFFLLLLMYWTMPSKRIHVKLVLPGTVFASTGIIVASFLYMIYVKYFCNYNLIYGALSSIMILLLWFFIIGYILELGILINSAVERSRR